MADAAEAITSYVARGRGVYDSDPAIRDAILYQIVVLGEAVKAALAADPSIESAIDDVEWGPIARMRGCVEQIGSSVSRSLVQPGQSSVRLFFQRFQRPPGRRSHFVAAIGALL